MMFYKRLLTNMKIIIAVLFLLSACSDSGTGPNSNKSVRDYTWTADTLEYPGSAQTNMSSIWGASHHDVYICGHNDRNNGSLWHFDGNEWTDVNFFSSIHLGPVELRDVHGISQNNVWVVGFRFHTNYNPPPNFTYKGFIMQYNGFDWDEYEVNTSSAIYWVYPDSPDNVWACGNDGVVYHYDGNNWDLDTIYVSPPVDGTFQLRSIASYNEKAYILAAKIEYSGAKQTQYFYSLENNGWVLQDSIISSESGTYKWGNKLYKTTFGKLYSYGYGGLFEFIDGTWINIYKPSYVITGVTDNGENDILISISNGKVFHYDGTNWEEINELRSEDIHYSAAYMDDSEAFVIGYTTGSFPQRTIVWHGK
jgi:hypothetical protein